MLTGLQSASAEPLSSVTAVSAADVYTCAVTTTGGLKCWGGNGYGQLGTRTARRCAFDVGGCSTTPVDVSGLKSGITAVAVGGGLDHTCVLTTQGGVKCWGANVAGKLGDGTSTDSAMPMDVLGLTSGVASVSAGDVYSCAVTTAGGAKCWGNNTLGQLGDSTTTDSHVPADVSGLTGGVAAISAGIDHACALTTVGGVKCWGRNDHGELGGGTSTGPQTCSATACSTTALDVSGLTSGVAALSVGGEGAYTCALTTAGGVKCWGGNRFGQLGDGTTTDNGTPVDVTRLTSGVAAIAAGGDHACALTTAGGVKCWGWNYYGQLGNGTTTNSTTPLDVTDLASGVIAVSTGASHTCAITSVGGVKCWGANFVGGLGDGTTTDRTTPVDVITESIWPMGDVNCDGAINAVDALLILQASAGLARRLACGQNVDVNGDGSINAVDVAIVLQYVAGLIPALPT